MFAQTLGRRPLAGNFAMTWAVMAILLFALFVFAVLTAAPVAAQSTPPACSDQIVGTRFTLPTMVVGQEALLPAVPGATAVCVESLKTAEGIAIKLQGSTPYTAVGNNDALTVDAEYMASLALGDPSFNGSLIKTAPALPDVTIVALTDLSDGVTIWVGNPRPAATAAPVMVDQWQDVRIPGNIAELAAGTSKWAGNGVTVKVTSGAAYSANGTAILPEVGKLAEYEFYVDTALELKLAGTVPGQRFYLEVAADAVTADSWLQRRVDPAAPAPQASPATSTVGSQYTNIAGACFSSATCTASQAVACIDTAPKLPCTPGDSLSVWGAPAPMTLWHALLIVK